MPTNVTGSMAQIFVSDFVANAALQNTFPIYQAFRKTFRLVYY